MLTFLCERASGGEIAMSEGDGTIPSWEAASTA